MSNTELTDLKEYKYLEQISNKYDKKWNILVLHGCLLGLEGLKFYLSKPEIINWANLKHLNLSHNLFNFNGIKVLSKIKLDSLSHLGLSKNFIGNEGFRHICHKADWPLLQTIDLKQNNVRQMFDLYNNKWQKIIFLNLDINNISIIDAIAALSIVRSSDSSTQTLSPTITIKMYPNSFRTPDEIKEVFSNLHSCSVNHKS